MSALEDLHTMTVPEYLRAEELLDWERTELIEGIVYELPTEKNRHRLTVKHVGRLLEASSPTHDVSLSGTVQLGDNSIVDPDVFVIDGAARQDHDDFVQSSAVPLVVEVSVSTLSKDLGPKLKAYAQAGIPEVWVIDPRPLEGWLLRHTSPRARRFEQVQRFDVGECAEALDVDLVRA